MKTAGAVLAAGASSRMGRPKALLRAPDQTSFVAAQVEALRAGGCTEVCVVVGDHGEQIRREGGASPDRWIPNPDPGRGQGSSLQLGATAVASGARLLIVLVDQGPVAPASVKALLCAPPTAWMAASVDGVPGHPALFGPAALAVVAALGPGDSPRAALESRFGAPTLVPVDDPAVLRNLNTPADYESYLQSV